MSLLTADDAWKAYENHEYHQAEQIWLALLAAAKAEQKESYLLGYGYVLTALNKYDQARELYRLLYEQTHLHIYLHQLGMVERLAKCYHQALSYFLQERELIGLEQSLQLAANDYEQGLIHHLLGHADLALDFALSCLELSNQCKDEVMLGCAYRLLGQLHVEQPEKARVYYQCAREHFILADDPLAVAELDTLAGQLVRK